MGLTYHDIDLADYTTHNAVAVGVSGGPDSMALAWLLKDWAAAHDIMLHILTVDHGLRAESADEAAMVAKVTSNWPNTTHQILNWHGDKPDTRIAEEARQARYRLMCDYCDAHNITYLFLAHHQDDQAETFLFRLAKGSGLDGLAAMKRVQARDSVILVRPFLTYDKDDLIALCDEHTIPYASDPTNKNEDYARPRLRAARDVLAQEGLSSKRLATTAARMARARDALETISDAAFSQCVKTSLTDAIALDHAQLITHPDEIILRVLLKAIDQIRQGDAAYPPRLEKVEKLCDAYVKGELQATTTLAGCLFVPDAKNGLLWVKREYA